MKKKLALIGNSDLGKNFSERYQDQYDIYSFFRPEFDITKKEDCLQLTTNLVNFEVVLVTSGIYHGDAWEVLLTNFVGPSCLALNLSLTDFSGHMIIIGSHAGDWPSWPGITPDRLAYNYSKKAVSEFAKGLEHSRIGKGKISIYNPSKFNTKMSGYTGTPVSEISDAIHYIINQ